MHEEQEKADNGPGKRARVKLTPNVRERHFITTHKLGSRDLWAYLYQQ